MSLHRDFHILNQQTLYRGSQSMYDHQEQMLQGERWKASHQASVVSILGADAPPVYSMGSMFYNVDRWTLRILVKQMCEWAKANPKCIPTQSVISLWVTTANNERVDPKDRKIVIAATPSRLSLRVALALVGGAYHEAWHTLYSCRRNLTVAEMSSIVIPRWAKVSDWSPLQGLLLEWSNIIEDIHIERRGNEEFPGCPPKMCELQDFILGQEEASRVGKDPEDLKNPLPITTGAFRDLGLGYDTELQRKVLLSYQDWNPQAYAIVETGPLKPYLDESINLPKSDVTGCLRIAMDVLVELSKLQNLQETVSKTEKCPKCSSTDLMLSAMANGKGGKVKGKAIQTCTSCGNQETIDMNIPAAQGTPQKAPQGAGGHKWDPDAAKTWELVATEILEAAAQGTQTGLKDISTALSEAYSQVRASEDADCSANEKPWRPWTTAMDIVQPVEPTREGKAQDDVRAKALLNSVRVETSFLRARLRAILQAAQQRSITHGVPKGHEISERMLVSSVASLKSGKRPDRAYLKMSDRTDTSIAAVIELDQSSSMSSPLKLQNASKCMIAIAEPLDALGGAVMAVGFRDGPADTNNIEWDQVQDNGCHRVHGICHDVFKSFSERFLSVRWRFANTRAVGGTPMSDGIQFGLDALRLRTETHRILFVITDGDPNPGHTEVIRRQLRLSAKNNILIIGVGIGKDSMNVMKLFPNHVWADKIEELPALLVAKLNKLIDFRKQ